MKKKILLLFFPLLLTHCSFIPDYQRPNTPVAETWNERIATDPSVTAPKEAACLSWNEYFSADQLKTILQLALQNNRDLRVAMLNVEATRELYRIERSHLFPTLSANITSTRQKTTKAENKHSTSSPNKALVSSDYTANLTTSFEIDLFGKIRSLSEAALQTYFATKAAQDVARITLISEVATAYFQWWADYNSLKLIENTLETQEKTLSLITKRYEEGISSKLDLSQARTELEKAKNDREIYTRLVNQDKNALILLMGIKQNEFPFDAPLFDNSPVAQALQTNLSSQVLLLRPDIHQAEHELQSANALIGNARAAFFPTISLTGSYGFASNELSDLFSGSAAGAWAFVPKISAPIFQGGSLVANLKYTEVQKQAAVAKYEKAIQTAFREVADSLEAYRTLDTQLKTYHQLLEAAQETYNLSHLRYKEGIDSFLTLLDAQRILLTAQKGEIDIKRQHFVNLVSLYKALGGGQKISR